MELRSAVVLAAGEGTRLRPLTRHRPKPMLPAATRPILEYVFDGLINAGVADITVVVGYKRERVQNYFGPTYRNVPLSYVTQDKQLGSGHALLTAEGQVDGPTIVVNGDQIVDDRIVRDVATAHANDPDAVATLGLLERSNVGSYGGALLDDGRVTELVERPRDERDYRLNAGVYAFDPDVFEVLRGTAPRDGEHSLVDAINQAIDSDMTVRGRVSSGLWVDATYPWDLLRVARELCQAGLVGETRAERIDRTASIHETATLREPVVVAPDCEVGPGAVLGPYACLGENVTVESNAVVEDSVLDDDTRAGPNATLIDCVTGQGVGIGPGTTVSGGPGDVQVGDRVFQGERLGALLADRARCEGGVTFAPGAMVGSDASLHAGATVRGTIAGGAEVID